MGTAYRFWPFRRQTAFFSSLVLVPLCLAVAVRLAPSGDHI